MKHFDFINLLALPPPLASILPEHAVVVNEANKHILLCPQDGAKVLVNGRTMEEGGKVELHHNDRFAGQGKGTVSVIHQSQKHDCFGSSTACRNPAPLFCESTPTCSLYF